MVSPPSKETFGFLFHAPSICSQVKDQGENASFMLPLPPLALDSILKALHLGEGVPSTLSTRVMGQKTEWEEKSRWTSVNKKKPFRGVEKGTNSKKE